MHTLSAGDVNTLDRAVLRGWAQSRPAVLVLGAPAFVAAVADLAPTSTLDAPTPSEVRELLVTLPAGALVVIGGRRRLEVMRAIVRGAPVALTVLWHKYARNYRHHEIESMVLPAQMVVSWGVFELRPDSGLSESGA